MTSTSLSERIDAHVHEWRIVPERRLETESSIILFGSRDDRPVVLKVVRAQGDEWRCGEVLRAFDGRGIVRVIEHAEGAVLLERLSPGTSLAELSLNGRDDEATEILADVIGRMQSVVEMPAGIATVETWGEAFERYLASGDRSIARDLVEHGASIYADLAASQGTTRLLHGDLQHYNVLFDSEHGWTAIDPKGVVGELEYEIGASMRNPYEMPALTASPAAIERRIRGYESRLGLDAERTLRWSFAQAVLSAIWSVEDGFAIDVDDVALMLARSIRTML